jgi:hypothetical protein
MGLNAIAELCNPACSLSVAPSDETIQKIITGTNLSSRFHIKATAPSFFKIRANSADAFP